MSSAVATTSPFVRRRWSSRRQWLVAIIAIITLVVIVFYWLSYRDKLALEKYIAQLHTSDPQWTFEEMQQALPPLKPSEDAGVELVELLKITTLRETIPFPSKSEWYKLYRKNYDEGELIHYEAFLDQNPHSKVPITYRNRLKTILQFAEVPDVLKRARALANYRTGRLEHKIKPFFFASLLPDAQGTRMMGNLLLWDSQLQMEAGNVDQVLADLYGILGVARVLDDDPFVICEFIRMALFAIVCKQTERLLAQPLKVSSRQLLEMQQALETELQRSATSQTKMLRQERAMYDHDLQVLGEGKQNYREVLQMFGRRSGFSFRVAWLDNLAAKLFPEIILGWGTRPMNNSKERMIALQFYTHGIEWSKQPEHLLSSSLAQWKKTGPYLTPYQRAIFMLDWTHNEKEDRAEFKLFSSVLKAWMNHRLKLRAAIAMLAMERYRLEKGAWPTSLEALVPGYLAVVPRDPETGKPLLLKIVPEGFIIYGVWNNGIDDGGKIRYDGNSSPLDAGYQLWHLPHRGKLMEKEAQEYFRERKTKQDPLQGTQLMQVPEL